MWMHIVEMSTPFGVWEKICKDELLLWLLLLTGVSKVRLCVDAYRRDEHAFRCVGKYARASCYCCCCLLVCLRYDCVSMHIVEVYTCPVMGSYKESLH